MWVCVFRIFASNTPKLAVTIPCGNGQFCCQVVAFGIQPFLGTCAVFK